jgi:hypothetical protein
VKIGSQAVLFLAGATKITSLGATYVAAAATAAAAMTWIERNATAKANFSR